MDIRMCLLAMKYCYKIILVHGHAMKITCEMKQVINFSLVHALIGMGIYQMRK